MRSEAEEKTSLFTWLVLLVIVVVAYKSATSPKGVDVPKPVVDASASQNTAPSPNAASEKPDPVLPNGNWETSSYKDDMTDEQVQIFSLKSKNSVNFEFPYNVPGGSFLTLYVRKGAKTFDAFVKVDKGQMICGYSDCGLAMRVNGGKSQVWKGQKSSTGNSDIMFIKDARSLDKIIKSGGTIRAGIEFYHAGQQTFDFDLSGYPAK